jgi:hypothetical protein
LLHRILTLEFRMERTPGPTLYAYPWDLAGTAPHAVAARMAKLGIGSITLAMSYHAGKFLRPWATGARVVFPEDGVLYFDPTPSLYGQVKPVGHSDPAQRRLAADLAPHIPLRAWLVLLHNTRIGMQDSALVARNAWGDPYVYSLCPSHDANRAYALAVCRDAASQPVTALVLETPGWLPYAHGYHHEFAQVRSNLWLDTLSGRTRRASMRRRWRHGCARAWTVISTQGSTRTLTRRRAGWRPICWPSRNWLPC